VAQVIDDWQATGNFCPERLAAASPNTLFRAQRQSVSESH
jgi:hypothetical protein